jgi:hypothetical protein
MRLAELSRRLDHDALIIGIDEHTAAIFNFEAERIDVTGAGSVTFRRHDGEQVVSSGEFISFSDVIRTEQSHRISTPDVTELSEPDVEVDIFSLIASQGPRWEFALQELIDHAAATTRHQESLERLVASIEEFRSVARATGNYEVADQLRHLLAGIGATTGDKKIAG